MLVKKYFLQYFSAEYHFKKVQLSWTRWTTSY